MNEKIHYPKLFLPCFRGTMGDWIYYVALANFDFVSERIQLAQHIHKNKGLKELLQRTITNRAQEISEYLCKQKQHFFNSIIAGIYMGEPSWWPIEVGGNERISSDDLPESVRESIGVLELSGAEAIFAIDGQHRVEGIRQALERDKKLGDEEQVIIFVAHSNTKKGIERSRRLFSTLNRYAKPVTIAEIIMLDEDDVIAIITRELLERHPLLSKPDIINVSKTKLVPRRNKKCLTSIQCLYETLDIILFPREATRKKKKLKALRPSDDKIAGYYKEAERFWGVMTEAFPQLRELQDNPSDENIAEKYRGIHGGHLIFRPAGLLCIAQAIRELVKRGYKVDTHGHARGTLPLRG